MCAHTRGRSPTSASSVGAASSPLGYSSPMRRHTQVTACLPRDCVVLVCSRSHMPLSNPRTFLSHPKQVRYRPCLLPQAPPSCFLSLQFSFLEVSWNWTPTACGLGHWFLSLSASSGLIHAGAGVRLPFPLPPSVFFLCG